MNWHDLCQNLKWKSFITSARLVSESVDAGQTRIINVDKAKKMLKPKNINFRNRKGSWRNLGSCTPAHTRRCPACQQFSPPSSPPTSTSCPHWTSKSRPVTVISKKWKDRKVLHQSFVLLSVLHEKDCLEDSASQALVRQPACLRDLELRFWPLLDLRWSYNPSPWSVIGRRQYCFLFCMFNKICHLTNCTKKAVFPW